MEVIKTMIVKPEQMDFSDKNIIMIILGLPGVGKTTLALSAPDVLLIDADEGISRVRPEHRKDTLIAKRYEDLLEDLKSCEGQYKTIVIDTCGALIELMKDWAMRTEPTASKKTGGFSQQGYGIIKSEFLRLSAELKRKFNVIYLFHVAKNKDGDETFYDLICEGSTKDIVWQPADLGAYLHIINGERYLGFTPTANYNAKAAYGIKGLVKVPELGDGDKNDFLTKLFEKVKANIKAEADSLKPQQEAYEKIMEAGRRIINAVGSVDNVPEAIAAINNLDHALTSKTELKDLLKKRLAELNIIYNKDTKTYEQR